MPIHVALEQVAGPHVLLAVEICAVHTSRYGNYVSFVDRVFYYRSNSSVGPHYSFKVEDALLSLSVLRSYSNFSTHSFLDQRSTSIKLLLPGPLQGVPAGSIRGEQC